MGETIRFGVSLDLELLSRFDELCSEKSYQTRSEAIRDLIRNALVQQQWEDESKETVGVFSLVYDHHQSDLTRKLTRIQHDALDMVITSLHVHLDHDNCLEVLIMRGQGRDIRHTAHKLSSTKGVKHSSLNMATTGKELL
ncbi:nickel-responsive transcriptional regulator NikR [Desulfonatronospira sp.]|uniref:nickel-responsive transcriptional regulator NikR n=1 Tax=Desulfonatronospira sp. TaxID=1962951 RepID=UPI0025C3CD4A|nr:nickel-responsive transcriptional regulator NikR [Desulfonatronospira sp.]